MNRVTSAVDRLLKQHFFQPVAAQSLSLFRFLYCLLLLWKVAGDWKAALDPAHEHDVVPHATFRVA